jgi:hypothetical protein
MGNKLVDFMIEALQGPCKRNQIELIQFNIHNACKDFINDLYNQQRYYNEIFKDHPGKLSILIRKIIKLLASLMEANHNQSLINF